jgi:Spy/CpxP family protein refolding chaperone
MKLINVWKPGALYVVALFLLLIIFSPARVFAQGDGPVSPPRGQGEARPPSQDRDLVRQLNLSQEQVEKIRAIREGNRELRRQIGLRIRAARIALDRAIYIENADDAVVEQRARELAEAQAAQLRLQALAELGVRRILTPEQLQTFQALRQRAEQRRRNRRLQEDGEQPPMQGGGPGEPGQPRDSRRPMRQRGGRP